ncbi:MAG: hypothetical protein NVS4B8_03880 [Herpetosiphon sp.]
MDKTPLVGARISTGQLGGRSLFAGLAGGVFARSQGESAFTGGAVGIVAAIVSTVVSYNIRRGIGQKMHVPDIAVAVMEDALVLALAARWAASATV